MPFIDDIAAPGWPVRVLEVGHGPGNTLIDLCELPVDVVGLDYSWAMSRRARRQLSQAGRALTVPLVAGRAEALPFASQAFAALVAIFPTRYVTEPATVSEFYRVLRPGGLVIIGQTAAITGHRLFDGVARAAMSLAQHGQTWPARLEASYAAQGFTVARERVCLERSEVTVVLARKLRPH